MGRVNGKIEVEYSGSLEGLYLYADQSVRQALALERIQGDVLRWAAEIGGRAITALTKERDELRARLEAAEKDIEAGEKTCARLAVQNGGLRRQLDRQLVPYVEALDRADARIERLSIQLESETALRKTLGRKVRELTPAESWRNLAAFWEKRTRDASDREKALRDTAKALRAEAEHERRRADTLARYAQTLAVSNAELTRSRKEERERREAAERDRTRAEFDLGLMRLRERAPYSWGGRNVLTHLHNKA